MKQKNLSNKTNKDPIMHNLIGEHDWKEDRSVNSFEITRVCRVCGLKEKIDGLSAYSGLAQTSTTSLASGTTLTLEDMEKAIGQLKNEYRLDFS